MWPSGSAVSAQIVSCPGTRPADSLVVQLCGEDFGVAASGAGGGVAEFPFVAGQADWAHGPVGVHRALQGAHSAGVQGRNETALTQVVDAVLGSGCDGPALTALPADAVRWGVTALA